MPIGLNARLYVYKALFTLGLEAPLDHKNYLRNAIQAQLGGVNNPISPDTLALVYDLLRDDDMGLFTFALARHVEFYEGVDYASKEYKEFNELYENAPEDVQGLWDGLAEKLQQRKEREARRQARSQPQQQRVLKVQAVDGDRMGKLAQRNRRGSKDHAGDED